MKRWNVGQSGETKIKEASGYLAQGVLGGNDGYISLKGNKTTDRVAVYLFIYLFTFETESLSVALASQNSLCKPG